ncbi:hypothetical protein ACFC58_42520 [Kitasatospora purpeofusca]|uniref:hypothetical protein n=1 Tax=Kitasatospora purpeofusca TaxID=67352 RepID=UPI0035D98AE9
MPPTDGRTTRSSFPDLHPISAPRDLPLLPPRIWSREDWAGIELGYRSRDMDEKWDVFTEADVVFLHRSWTGNEIYRATFTTTEDGGRTITGAVVERDPERYNNSDDAYDCLMLELVLSAIVLGEPATELREKLVHSARERAGGAEVPAGLVQHSALGLRSTP